jgi:hypothetical protein
MLGSTKEEKEVELTPALRFLVLASRIFGVLVLMAALYAVYRMVFLDPQEGYRLLGLVSAVAVIGSVIMYVVARRIHRKSQ